MLNHSHDIFLVVWGGGYDVPQYETCNSEDGAWDLARSWQSEMDEEEGDVIDVLRISTLTGTVERLQHSNFQSD